MELKAIAQQLDLTPAESTALVTMMDFAARRVASGMDPMAAVLDAVSTITAMSLHALDAMTYKSEYDTRYPAASAAIKMIGDRYWSEVNAAK